MPTATLPAMSEKQWQSQVVQLAAMYGFTRQYHTYDSRRSAKGFPDLVLVRPAGPRKGRCLFVELKAEKGRLSPEQEQWIEALKAAGAEIYVWRPSQVQEVADVLSR